LSCHSVPSCYAVCAWPVSDPLGKWRSEQRSLSLLIVGDSDRPGALHDSVWAPMWIRSAALRIAKPPNSRRPSATAAKGVTAPRAVVTQALALKTNGSSQPLSVHTATNGCGSGSTFPRAAATLKERSCFIIFPCKPLWMAESAISEKPKRAEPLMMRTTGTGTRYGGHMQSTQTHERRRSTEQSNT